ncbi:hypothetical protein L1987_60149 [Smallanthus sonchifolius]|uniref:Uncharacterized protein n=1 Tax=Smallanthus sonchifolius TaxID=185202 RepID=A0ACB9D833_9ASTR|nr:hypothetical protein L1987_60149 [Smallanthus sonchifolius]
MNQFNTFHRRVDPFDLFDLFAATLKHPRTPRNPYFDYPLADSDHMTKRARLMEITYEEKTDEEKSGKSLEMRERSGGGRNCGLELLWANSRLKSREDYESKP